MKFLNPPAFILLLLLPAATAFFVWRRRVRQEILRRVGEPSLLARLLPGTSRARWLSRRALWLLCLGALVVALARPVWGEEVTIIETQGASVIIALDVSRSMDARDVVPSRLERAKLALADLFNGLAGNELGLILFAGSAFLQFPLTVDTASASTLLRAASTDAITDQGTNIDAALQLAIDSFRSPLGTRRIIVLLTDGEDHVGQPLDGAALAAEQGIVIHAITYGSPQGAVIPLRDSSGAEIGLLTDDAGNQVVTVLDESLLREIAVRTGGTYQRATATGAEITALVDLISTGDAHELETRSQRREIDRFGIFVALALCLLSLEMLLPGVERSAP